MSNSLLSMIRNKKKKNKTTMKIFWMQVVFWTKLLLPLNIHVPVWAAQREDLLHSCFHGWFSAYAWDVIPSTWFPFPDFFVFSAKAPRGGEGYNLIEWTTAGDRRHFLFFIGSNIIFLFFGAENLKISKKQNPKYHEVNSGDLRK